MKLKHIMELKYWENYANAHVPVTKFFHQVPHQVAEGSILLMVRAGLDLILLVRHASAHVLWTKLCPLVLDPGVVESVLLMARKDWG